MKASVLGIGTELTDGQIVNKNGAWISAKLKEQGFVSALHLVVPDDRSVILEALDFCAQKSDWLFVTGGLGPTSDDFTRDVIAAWAGQPLEFHEPSWQHVNERMTGRGFVVREIQKQQCYFPRGSTVIKNNHGTANAFTLEARGKKIFVLPGPPREIEAVWSEGIAPWLAEKSAGRDPFITRKWDTLGRGESDIALLTEAALEGIDVEKGYRVHLPYVEVKLSYFQSRTGELTAAIQRVEQALAPFTVARDGEDMATLVAQALKSTPGFHIVDEVSGGFLLSRLLSQLKLFEKSDWSFSTQNDGQSRPYSLKLVKHDGATARAIFAGPNGISEEVIPTPYATANMAERSRQYWAERALIFWRKKLIL